MDSVAFSLFGLDIKWYGIIMSSAIIIGIFLAKFRSKTYELDFDKLLDIILITLPCTIVGARTYYVIFNWDYYGKNPSEILNLRGGGLAIHGAIIATILAGYFLC